MTNHNSPEPEWHPMAGKFARILAGEVPSLDDAKNIRIANAPKRHQEDVANSDMKMDLSNTAGVVPFKYAGTYKDRNNDDIACIEEWRRVRPDDDHSTMPTSREYQHLTKVQVNYITGAVTVIHSVRGQKNSKTFDLNKAGAFQSALKSAFLAK